VEEAADAQQYSVLARSTERAGSSPLNKEKRRGTYVCAAVRFRLSSATKFESGTAGRASTRRSALHWHQEDNSFFSKRTEVHAAAARASRHVFDDGPKPTGLATA
jgi:peptide-methionine (R)-S-oxide reductase